MKGIKMKKSIAIVVPIIMAMNFSFSSLAYGGSKGVGVIASQGHKKEPHLKIIVEKWEKNVWIILRENEELAINDRIKICVQSDKAGYVALWDNDTTGPKTLILPNRYHKAKKAAVPIQAGEKICAGDGTKGFYFEIQEPTGPSSIWAHWTPSEGDALQRNEVPTFKGLGKMQVQPGPPIVRNARNYASSTFSFNISR